MAAFHESLAGEFGGDEHVKKGELSAGAGRKPPPPFTLIETDEK
ncbi:MAG: hypothetical protein WBF43_08340 [Methylocella sp.]